jgi:hypothetical protein
MHKKLNFQPIEQETLSTFALMFVLVVAAILRLYNLDTPSMWLDEILVPMAASHPIEYIFDLCKNSEVHPPGFYLVIKAIMVAGTSDFALRALSAACGIASVYLAYVWIREMSGPDTAVLGAAFLAVNPLHIYDSRVVRPYALFLFIMLLGLLWLFRFLRNGDWRSFKKFLFANAGLLLLHYAAILLAGAFGVLLMVFWGLRRTRNEFKAVCLFGATSLMAFSLDLPFFLGRIEKTHKGQFMGYDLVDASLNTLGKVVEVAFMFKQWPLRAAFVLAVLAGGLWLLRGGDRVRRMVLLLFIVPLSLLLATKYDYYAYNVWHLSFLLPLLAGIAGHCLGFFRKAHASVAAVILTAGMGVYLFTAHGDDYFRADSAILPYYVLSKPLARDVPAHLKPGDIVAASDFGFFNGLNWYLNQFVSSNPVIEQHLDDAPGAVPLHFLSGAGQFGDLAKNEVEFLEKMGPPQSIATLHQSKLYTYLIARNPGLIMESLPGGASVHAGLREFYSKVDRFEGLTFDSNWGGAFCPVLPGKKAFAEFHVDNGSSYSPQLITMGVRYRNEGKGNILRMLCRFDDEEEWEAFSGVGPDHSTTDVAIVERRRPYSRLNIRCELLLAPLTASFPGGNQGTLRLEDVFVSAEALQ